MDNLEKHRMNREFPRSFLPEDIDLADWTALDGLFLQLREREIGTCAALEKWLLDFSELRSAIEEEAAVRYIRMTCHTDNPDNEQAYTFYIGEIMPRVEVECFALNRKYLDVPARAELPPERFRVYDRARDNEVRIFREENVALKTEDEKLAQQFQKVCGEVTVPFDGKECTLPQISRYYEETDREVRRAAWTAATLRQIRDRETIEDIFDRMLELRNRVAHNAGFENYIGFQFRNLGRFDYNPADCLAFHSAIEEIVVPLARRLRLRRRMQLRLDRLAPWDLAVDALGREPLRPFASAGELVEGADAIFASVAPVFSQEFGILREKGLLDLDSRRGKAPGGYQSSLDETRLPFIFMNAAGRNRDVFTLLHEGGHAFHALAARQEPVLANRSAPIEFCEVASMGMEMMGCERLAAFYDPESAQRAREMHLEDTVVLLPWIARVDAFQHWVYMHPGHTRRERADAWLDLDRRFGDDLDWADLPEWRECSWIAKLHLFCVPLYYIEYGIAQIGALQLWRRFLDDPGEAVDCYRLGLSLGNTRTLPELFEATGIRFVFDSGTMRPLIDCIAGVLGVEEK